MSQRPKRKPLEQFYKEEDDELLEGNHMKLYISYLPSYLQRKRFNMNLQLVTK